MDNKKMLILGGGALGFAALGYFGLQFMNDEEEGEIPELVFSKKDQLNKKIKIEKEVEEEVKEVIKNVREDSEGLYNSIDNSIDNSKDNSKEKPLGWGEFWKTTYNDKTEVVEQ